MSRKPLYERIARAATLGKKLTLSAQECAVIANSPMIEEHIRRGIVEWRKVPGFPDYEVSDQGDVRRGMAVLKPHRGRYGHGKISLYNGARKQFRTGLHRLVCLVFHGPPPRDKPFACHRNGNAWDDSKDNLYWGSLSENLDDARRHRLFLAWDPIPLRRAETVRVKAAYLKITPSQ